MLIYIQLFVNDRVLAIPSEKQHCCLMMLMERKQFDGSIWGYESKEVDHPSKQEQRRIQRGENNEVKRNSNFPLFS